MFSCMLKTEKRDLGKCDLVIVTRHFIEHQNIKLYAERINGNLPRKRLDLKSNFAPILSYLNLVTNNWDKNSYHCA